jgi:F0F1-type ATP synthase assembly protein I
VKFAGLGFVIPSCVVGGYFFGAVLDRFFHTNYLYIVFLLIGAVAGLFAMVREARDKT